MPFYLAIDAGGTKTDFLLADETREIARARTGTIKRMRADADITTANLEQALAELTAKTGISMQSIHCTCIGTAGWTVPLVTDFLKKEIPACVAGKFILLEDIEIAVDAAFFGKPGVLAIAGTGSNVAGRDANGNLTGAGGYGPALADQGSGHRIGNEALRAIFLANDRGITTTLLPAVLEHWNLTSLEDIVAFANQRPAPDFSQLTELVVRCASNGDAVAAEVLRQQGEELGELVLLVMHRIQKASTDAAVPPVAFTGSILEKVLPVREALVASLRRDFPTVHVLDGTVDPIEGALWRARKGQ